MPRKHPAFEPSTRFFGLLCVLVLCAASIDCGESCISGVINPPDNMLQVKTCSITVSNGTMNVSFHGAAGPATSSNSFSIRHIFVTVSGVEISADGSSRWDEIAPELENKPIQIDLLADDVTAEQRLVEAQVAPGNYSAVRLRVAPESVNANFAPGENMCRSAGVNCAVDWDGAIRSLIFALDGVQKGVHGRDAGAPDVLIASTQISGGLLRILPEAATNVDILFRADLSSAARDGESLVLTPIFGVESSNSQSTGVAADPNK